MRSFGQDTNFPMIPLKVESTLFKVSKSFHIFIKKFEIKKTIKPVGWMGMSSCLIFLTENNQLYKEFLAILEMNE